MFAISSVSSLSKVITPVFKSICSPRGVDAFLCAYGAIKAFVYHYYGSFDHKRRLDNTALIQISQQTTPGDKKLGLACRYVIHFAAQFGIVPTPKVWVQEIDADSPASSYEDGIASHITLAPMTHYAPSEIKFLICHELSHIKNRDSSAQLCLSLLISIIDCALHLIFPQIGWTFWVIKTALLRIGFHCCYVKIQLGKEKRADLEAVKIIGDAEGGISFFKRALEAQQELMRDHMACPWYDLRGNNLINSEYHPSLAERIRYLTVEQTKLLNRRVEFIEDENHQMNRAL